MTRDREFELLAQRYVDGEATASDVEYLNARLRTDPEARQWFVELLNIDVAIEAAVADGIPVNRSQCDPKQSELVHCPDLTFGLCATDDASTGSLSAVPNSTGTASGTRIAGLDQALAAKRVSITRWMLATVACAALVAGGLYWRQLTGHGFATVHSGTGVDELADGTVLRGEEYEIEAGTVELVTRSGARVVIEAPARFRFESAQRLYLTRGRLAADVPPSAKGFTVVTPTGQAIDLGTKFGVDVPPEGKSEIHVFQGEVIAQSSGGGKRQSLHDGEAYRLQSGTGAVGSLRSGAFIRPEEVTSLHAALAAGQRSRSDAALADLRRDPALIVLLDFESDDLPPGDYRMVQGRWPGSRAPEFVDVGDYMRLNVGGDREWPQITLAAWVRLDRLGEPYQSLLHTDGWNQNNFGQVHWMVTRHTTMRLALFGNTLVPDSDEREGYPDSRTSVLPEQGRWVHLATVYDSTQRTVRFYLNGQFDKETRQEVAHPARLGPAQIGNWDQHDRKLSGRIDELLVLGRVMSDNEVRALHEAGNPYR